MNKETLDSIEELGKLSSNILALEEQIKPVLSNAQKLLREEAIHFLKKTPFNGMGDWGYKSMSQSLGLESDTKLGKASISLSIELRKGRTLINHS